MLLSALVTSAGSLRSLLPARALLAPSGVARFALVLAVTAGLIVIPATGADAAASKVDRVAGADRVATAVEVARTGWDTAPHALLATSLDYPDAIAAAAYAARSAAPVLLTPPTGLPGAVEAILADLGTTEVTILGGDAAVPTRIERRLRDLGIETTRVAGDDRFETAAAIALQAAGSDGAPLVALALGARKDQRDAWPDALAAASLAGLDSPAPTLLTAQGDLPSATADALALLAPSHVVVLGGDAAIADPVVEQIQGLGYATIRAFGDDRYETAVEVAEAALAGFGQADDTISGEQAVFVSGGDFPDALAAGALAARRSAPLLLVPQAILSDDVDAFIRDGDLLAGVLVGGTAAVSSHVQSELEAAVRGEPRPQRPPPPPPPCPPNSSPDCAYTYEHPIETWERLARCESGGNWHINTGNGYYGGLQFSLSSWRGVGGPGYPHQNSKWEQIHRAELLQDRQGWGAWPSCSRRLGLR
ncbi:MAG: cell wall-binding repeat-containing protein [Actinobacteria bacterium]|nr:cell wall-binding repeat-containing protein [Actinomycetota bacterium]